MKQLKLGTRTSWRCCWTAERTSISWTTLPFTWRFRNEGHDLETVRLLLDRGADVHAAHDALPIAAEHGFIDLCILLLDRGADVHAHDERALRNARRNGHTAVIALLLERGALEPEED